MKQVRFLGITFKVKHPVRKALNQGNFFLAQKYVMLNTKMGAGATLEYLFKHYPHHPTVKKRKEYERKMNELREKNR